MIKSLDDLTRGLKDFGKHTVSTARNTIQLYFSPVCGVTNQTKEAYKIIQDKFKYRNK